MIFFLSWNPYADPYTEHHRFYGVVTEVTRSEAGILLRIEDGRGGWLRVIPETLLECDVRKLSLLEAVGKINSLLTVMRRTGRELVEAAEEKE